MKKYLIIGGSLALGAFGLWLWNKRQSSNKGAITGLKAPNNSLGSAPRVDNASQPWYHGATDFLKSKVDSVQSNPTAALQNFGSVIKSTADIWGNVSGWFGDSSTTDSPDSNPEVDMTFEEDPTEMPSSEYDQSDIWGSEVGQNEEYASEDISYYDDSYGEDSMIGAENSDFSYSA